MIKTDLKIEHNGEIINLIFDIKNFQGNENEFVRITKSKIHQNINSMIDKSLNVLIPFTKQIFDNEYEEKEGYFEFFDIEITDALKCLPSDIYYKIDFSLESAKAFVMHYCSYSVVFNSNFTLTSVDRY